MGLCFFNYVSSDVALCETSDRMIESRALDVTYSQGVRGDIRLDDDSIESAFNLSRSSSSYNDGHHSSRSSDKDRTDEIRATPSLHTQRDRI